jgi:hypothetical protein
MTRNPILDELHKTRERLLAEAGGTLAGLVAKLQREERCSGREFYDPKSRSANRAEATPSKESLKDVAAEISREARERGLTPEILKNIIDGR